LLSTINESVIIGKTVIFVEQCHSTNDMAHDLIKNNNFENGTIFACKDQFKGKGQRGNIWETESGKNLTFSIIFQPENLDVSDQFYLSMAVACGIRDGLSQYISTPILKWPNDIYTSDFQKIGGVLIENMVKGKYIGNSILGIGINVNQDYFKMVRATSMLIESNQKESFKLQSVFQSLIVEIDKYLVLVNEKKFEILKNTYLNSILGLNSIRSFIMNGEFEYQFQGIITDINRFGEIVIVINGEAKEFDIKEITFLF